MNRAISEPGFDKPVPANKKKSENVSSSTSSSRKQKNDMNQKRSVKATNANDQAESFAYWPEDDVNKGVADGAVILGAIRINPKNFRQGFIAHSSGFLDVYIPWRNRAFNGDIVAVYLLARPQWKVLTEDLQTLLTKLGNPLKLPQDVTSNNHLTWVHLSDFVKNRTDVVDILRQHYSFPSEDLPDRFLQPVGKVVRIMQEKNTRVCAGTLQRRPDGNTKYALFVPNDSRIPRIDILAETCPPEFLIRPQDYLKTLFVCHVDEWKEGMARASGSLLKQLGSSTELEPVTTALLLEHGIDCDDFDEEVLNCLPSDLPWSIPQVEYEQRRDFRRECVFSIDPATARDLDDALSCRQIDDDMYEIGVHIADVSYFVKDQTALDGKARLRATSVYLVQKVIPMLPRLLCEKLCSLNPGEDRLSFSVVWHVDKEGHITDEWFGRTTINSCCKLSYDHAQGFIEDPDRVWSAEELPPISKGFTVEDLKTRVLVLDKIAKLLRRRRFENGALRLDQIKLSFSLDKTSGYPTGFSIYELKDSNRLIEEFMLLANMAVARKIYESFPKLALLRRHPEPQGKQLSDLENMCETLGIVLDTTSSRTLQESLARFTGDSEEDQGRLQMLLSMCVKPMQLALYFCTGTLSDTSLYRHYALSVPLYTHFTSPIRRYADIMVHRLLAASLGLTSAPLDGSQEVEAQARHCNDKKNNAKKAGDLSMEIFFVTFLKMCGSLQERAMVVNVLDRAIDLIIIRFGSKKRVYCDKLDLASEPVFEKKDGSLSTLTLTFKSGQGQLTLSPFSMVDCILKAGEDITSYSAFILPPKPQ